MLIPIVLAALAESIVSFSGGFFVLMRKSVAEWLAHRMLGFAIGALIGVTFFDVIPEAMEAIGEKAAFGYVALGIMVFFAAEKALRWYHHHHGGHDGEIRPFATLILFGDAIHNFIDGIALAVSFLVSLPLGIATTVAVLVHEVPQEVADFGVLIRGGYSRSRALWANFAISLTTLAGALLGYAAGESFAWLLPYLLAVIGGNFLYIAMSDLIPETHEETGMWHLIVQLALMSAGIGVMYFLGLYFAE
ncbi:MAG: ZIP family metal transporter [Candidatus Sungbacteria bacterium]|uniref:ZIP family metal transporter n=1 Tax=Candidatus Sungiibacteriota bacterium TaxID=2750080 RepID=A0A933DTM6_9BACT|nr:ZIP family metal transporter [Candidatus Sungbacteria bacterium]